MRFMLLYKGDPPADATPSTELIEAMLRFDEELAKAGVLLASEGLHSSGAAGWRVVYKAGKRTVVDGPFAESKELVAGFNLIEVKSKEEAIEWASRVPVEYAVQGDEEAVIEIRQVAEASELPEMTEEQREQERQLRDRMSGRPELRRQEGAGMTDYDEDAQELPGPHPELKRLERFVGTWSMKGRTLDADEDNVFGTTTFEWLPGGFFLQQRVEIDFTGQEVRGLEIIGYDPSTDRFPSTVYSNLVGTPIPYEYDVRDDRFTIRTELAGGATFTGSFDPDGNSGSGGWRPDEGKEGPGNVAYDITVTRVS